VIKLKLIFVTFFLGGINLSCGEPAKQDPSGQGANGSDGGNSNPDARYSTIGVDAGGVCETWVVDYDLSGSRFDIRNTPFGAGDASNEVGPGTLQLRFPDNNGDLGTGSVTLLSYRMAMNFDVTMVVSDLIAESGPDECGIAKGDFAAGALNWAGPLKSYHVHGTITCNASLVLCSVASLPHEEAKAIDNTTDQALNPFAVTLSGGRSSLTMDYVEVPNDDAGDTFLRLVGTETGRVCVPSPDCN
jgi:hypothetical protein